MGIRVVITFLFILATNANSSDYYNWEEGEDHFFKAQITVLDAPVFHKPSLKSKVIMRFRKGEIIRVHPNTSRNNNAFYSLIDKLGKKAYIPKDFVHVFYHDARELSETDLPYDPTDYRITEPLPESYPFLNNGKDFRSLIIGGVGTQIKKNYNYGQRITKENYGTKMELGFAYLYSPEFDHDNRFYIGVGFQFNRSKNQFELQNGITSQETWLKFGIGPYMMYDLYRYKQEYSFGISGGFNYNIVNQNTITTKDQLGDTGIQKYSGLSFTPHAGFNIQKRRIRGKDMDLIGGVHVYYDINKDMKPSTSNGSTQAWQEGELDVVKHRSVFELSLYIGLQFNT